MSVRETRRSPSLRPVAANVLVLAAALVLSVVGSGAGETRPVASHELEGRASTPVELEPGVEAAFGHKSYLPGSTARLRLFARVAAAAYQLFQAGPETVPTVGNNEMQGIPVTGTIAVGAVAAGRTIPVAIGDWPSGLYFARLTGNGGLVGFAPFVVSPSHPGAHRVAVVMPTLTWQAYNLRDDDRDGIGDSWYADWKIHTVRLDRPFLDRGVPPNFRRYDLPFLHWLSASGKQVDVLSDSDLTGGVTGDALARDYSLIVFPGHEEYVTSNEYEAVRRYRDLGGHLMFLSADNFFWQVVVHGQRMERTERWRDLGRPEAALIGVQYLASASEPRGAWVVGRAPAASWIFAGTGLEPGAAFDQNGGIEIDHTAGVSPEGVQVVAQISNLFGPGFTAQMSYYETKAGAEVFAAGAFRFVTLPLQPQVTRMLENLWQHLAGSTSARVSGRDQLR